MNHAQQSRKKRWRWLLVLSVAVAAVIGVNWLRRPAALRVIGEYTDYPQVVAVRNDGVLTTVQRSHDSALPGSIVFRGWDGTVRWQVKLPVGGYLPRSYAVSPNGLFLTIFHFDTNGTPRVTTWRDGHPLAACRRMPCGYLIS